MSAWENYWRGGYTIEGASDVIVTTYARSKGIAEREAKAAVGEDLDRLAALGIERKVTLWVEPWKTRQVTERGEREVFDTRVSKRRTEARSYEHEQATAVDA